MKGQEINLRFFKNVEVESTDGFVAFMEGSEAQDFLQSCPNGLFKAWAWKAHDVDPSFRAFLYVTDQGRIIHTKDRIGVM